MTRMPIWATAPPCPWYPGSMSASQSVSEVVALLVEGFEVEEGVRGAGEAPDCGELPGGPGAGLGDPSWPGREAAPGAGQAWPALPPPPPLRLL